MVSSGDDEEEEEADPTQIALPTLLMAGTIFGAIFRADLSRNKVDVETNNLRKDTLCSGLFQIMLLKLVYQNIVISKMKTSYSFSLHDRVAHSSA